MEQYVLSQRIRLSWHLNTEFRVHSASVGNSSAAVVGQSQVGELVDT
jgi:hypothetical protein